MADSQIQRVRRTGWRRKARTHQGEPQFIIRRIWDVMVWASLLKDPERPGHMFLKAEWLQITKKELKYVQLGFLSDSRRFPMYEVIGRLSTGLVIYRDLRQTSSLEAYFQHRSRATPVHARGANDEYHSLRQDIFDWFWGYRALVKANKIPDPGMSWFWVVHMVAQVLRDSNEDARPKFIRAWPQIDTNEPPILRRGIYAEADTPAPQPGSVVSKLLSSGDLANALKHPELVARADAVALLRVTGEF